MRSKDGKYNVAKTPNGTFRVRFFDETGVRRSANVGNVAERDLLIRAIKRQQDLDQWFPPDNVIVVNTFKTFEHLAAKFMEHRNAVREVSDSCLWNYETQLNTHIFPVLGRIKLFRIAPIGH